MYGLQSVSNLVSLLNLLPATCRYPRHFTLKKTPFTPYRKKHYAIVHNIEFFNFIYRIDI